MRRRGQCGCHNSVDVDVSPINLKFRVPIVSLGAIFRRKIPRYQLDGGKNMLGAEIRYRFTIDAWYNRFYHPMFITLYIQHLIRV